MFQKRTASFAYKLLFDFDSNVLITMNKTPQNINGLTNDSGFVDINISIWLSVSLSDFQYFSF